MSMKKYDKVILKFRYTEPRLIPAYFAISHAYDPKRGSPVPPTRKLIVEKRIEIAPFAANLQKAGLRLAHVLTNAWYADETAHYLTRFLLARNSLMDERSVAAQKQTEVFSKFVDGSMTWDVLFYSEDAGKTMRGSCRDPQELPVYLRRSAA